MFLSHATAIVRSDTCSKVTATACLVAPRKRKHARMNRSSGHSAACELCIQCEAARQIRQHARSSLKAEICGVLIGSEEGAATVVQATIPGANAVEAGTHVTFTQDTWEHIY